MSRGQFAQLAIVLCSWVFLSIPDMVVAEEINTVVSEGNEVSVDHLFSELRVKRRALFPVQYEVEITTRTETPSGEVLPDSEKQGYWVNDRYIKFVTNGRTELFDRTTKNLYRYEPGKDLYEYIGQSPDFFAEVPGATGPNWFSGEMSQGMKLAGTEVLDGKATLIFEYTPQEQGGTGKVWIWKDNGFILKWEASASNPVKGINVFYWKAECKNIHIGKQAMFEVPKEKIFGDEPQEMDQLMREESYKREHPVPSKGTH
jgi:hypothetical protein